MTWHTNRIYSLAVLPNGDLASGSFDSIIKVWDSNTGILRKILSDHTSTVWPLAKLQNGDLTSGSGDRTIKIWDIDSLTVKRSFIAHSWNIYSWMKNGNLASGSFQEIRILQFGETSSFYLKIIIRKWNKIICARWNS